MNKQIRIYLFFFIFCTCSIAIILFVYTLTEKTIEGADTNLAARNIETPAKLWLNGYLGPILGFRYMGNINWLIIPLFFLFYTLKKPTLDRKHFALISFFIFAFILIALKGFFNSRYSYTLLVFILFFVFYLTWKIHDIPELRKLKYFSLLLLLLGISYNLYKAMNTVRFKEKKNTIFTNKQTESGSDSTKKEINFFESISKLPSKEIFLVNNLPDFYYHTNRKGLYYWCGDDHYYSPEGRGNLFNKTNTKEVLDFLTNNNCKYIYTSKHYFNYNKNFDDFIKEHCSLMVEDEEKRLLYKINP